MVETLTQHYGWTKPEVTKSASTWGGFLNTDLDSIDALIFANQQGMVPIGSVTMWAGNVTAPPANWLVCDGASYSTAAPYDKLYAVILATFGQVDAGHFNVPNLLNRFPYGAVSGTRGQTGGEAVHQLVNGELPAHAHPIVDVAHNHGVNQWSHSHGDGAGHAHTASQVAHAHTYIQTNASHPGLAAGGSFAGAFDSTTGPAQPAITVDPQHVSLDTQTSNISLNANGTGLTATQPLGGNLPHNNMPPYIAIGFIIRYA